MSTQHPNSFGAKATLTSGSRTVSYFALAALNEYDLTRLPSRSASSSKTSSATKTGRTVTADDIKLPRPMVRNRRTLPRDRLHARASTHAGLHRRSRHRRPRRHAPAPARRARHRPLRPGRRVRHRQRLRHERRARVPAQPRALRLPQVGPDRLQQLLRRPARHGHLPPGQPRIPRPRRLHHRLR